jgi:2-oxoglutarate ferredoxin oxidoreductase subunit delta
MAKYIGHIEVDIQKCKGCDICVVSCPFDIMAMSKEVNNKGYRYAELVAEGCTGCTNCAVVCPDSVITVYKIKNPVKEVA